MFERYTEKARRVIFYARYEASTFGCLEIDTEHLLLALLREDKGALTGYLQTPVNVGAFRARMQEVYGKLEAIPTSADLPLAPAATQVLTYAAEEAEALHHAHIGTEHLVLGLLREEHSLASGILARTRSFARGGSPEDERDQSATEASSLMSRRVSAGGRGTTLTQRGEVLLTVRTEESGESAQDSRPPAPEI